MPKTIYIVGTDHKYQNRSEKFTELQHEGFESYISQIISERSVAILAEENNEQAIKEKGLTESSIQKLARIHSSSIHFANSIGNLVQKMVWSRKMEFEFPHG